MNMFEPTFESLRTRQVPTWFEDAKIGLFAHWTVGSVPSFAPMGRDPFTLAREEGEEVAFSHTPYAEWYWNSISIPGSPAAEYHEKVLGNPDYQTFVDKFLTTARDWDPNHWRDVFARSGAQYCVFVTKHHDGVLMWPSDTPNPVHGNVWQSERDLVGECARITRELGMRFGVYYSGGIDWTFQGLGIKSWATLFAAIPQEDAYLEYADSHWRELIERYQPDVLWNDIGYPKFSDGAMPLIADFYNQNPDGVVNDRFDMLGVIQGRSHTDFTTPEYTTRPMDAHKKFEVCRGIGTSFGYMQFEDDTSYMPIPELITMFANIVADGGNLLLNFGAMPGGYIPWAQQLRIFALGSWLADNGAAIYGSRPFEQSTLSTDEGHVVRLTKGRDGAVYAMVCGRPSSSRIVIDGLPEGEVHLVKQNVRVARRGNVLDLPIRPDDTPVWTLRIGR
ncbi:MAG: alpha-L-fucosidase [Actinomycetota bacterium]